MVTLTGAYYSNLVRDSYANMILKSRHYKTDNTTIVKVVRIHLNQAILATF